MPALCSRYCGMVLYLPNSACHAAASSGGITPVTGFHSTIDRPDSVSRVAPPTTTVTNIRAATASSHSRTARRRGSANGARSVMGSFACRGRRGPYSCVSVPAIEPHDAHPRAQAHRCDPADRLGGDVGAPRDGVGAIAASQGQRRDRGDLLCGRGARLGAAGDAAHSLDVAARPRINHARAVANDVTLLSSAAPAPLERYLFEYVLIGLRYASDNHAPSSIAF